jgi:hypothetical protein
MGTITRSFANLITATGPSAIADNSIVNADINSSAAIAYSKLNLATSITSSDLASTFITGATSESTIAGGDQILIYDDSAGAFRKMTRTNFVSGVGGVNTPLVSASHTTGITYVNNTATRFPLNSATFDTAGFYDSANTRITIPAGTSSAKALIVWQTAQSNNYGNNCGGYLYKNNSAIQYHFNFYVGDQSEFLYSGGAFITNYAAGDFFNIYAFTDGGNSSYSSIPGTNSSFLHMFKLIE